MQFEYIYLCLLNNERPSIQEFDKFIETLRVRIRAEFRYRCKRYDLEKNESIIDEVLSDTLECISRYIYKFSPEKGNFLRWTYGIIRNLCLNYANRNYSFDKIGVDHATLLPDDEKENGDIFEYLLSTSETQKSAESKVLEEEMLQHIRIALDRLPQKQYIVMRLHYLEGLSIREISIKLQVDAKNVSRNLYKARKNMLKYLTEMGYSILEKVESN
jgi:RNA polymerase sigma factor (sigma-70 family)